MKNYNVKFGIQDWNGNNDLTYCESCSASSNLFGCICLHAKHYCILNKQYTKEEYFVLREKIISNLEKNPYVDSKGRVFKYGEFFPYDLSLFSYNESFAQQYFSLNKNEINSFGFKYLEPKKPDYKETIMLKDIPDSINEIPEDFSKEILKCSCGKFYRIAIGELKLLKRFNIPVPRKCPDCRHMARIKRVNPPFLYNRNCDKCGIEIKTSFAPDRPEIIYCEKCYKQEVY
jgi:hypothetical protein